MNGLLNRVIQESTSAIIDLHGLIDGLPANKTLSVRNLVPVNNEAIKEANDWTRASTQIATAADDKCKLGDKLQSGQCIFTQQPASSFFFTAHNQLAC